MATRDKAAGSTATIRTLSNTTAWVGGVVPISGDDARWISTSSSGAHTGSITCDRVIIEGATGGITYTTGTITFVSTGDFFRSINNSGITFTLQGGTLALGGANRDCRLYTSTGAYTLQLTGANSITGTAPSVLNVINHLGTGFANNAYITVGNTQSGFVGTVRLTALSGIFTEAASSATSGFNAATIICDGAGWLIGPASGAAFIGGSGRTMTINQDGRIGWPTRSMTALSDVQLVGTGTRTLEVLGITTISGAVTGTNGVTLSIQNSTGTRAGATTNVNLQLTGASSGLSGACSISGGRLLINPTTTANRYAPSSLTVASDATFEYFPMSNTGFTFPCAPSGTGFVAILGNYTAGSGVTFNAGQLSSFAGVVRAFPLPDAGFQAARIRLSELPLGGLDWFASPSNGNAMTGEITYLGTTASYASNLTLDSQVNTSLPGLTGGVYSLIVPDTSGVLTITGTVQRLNTAGSSSARMSLTLGGSNTGNNTLSGNITEAGGTAILGIAKVDAGRWVLSGANSSHTGLHMITAGTLAANSTRALGSATSPTGVTIDGTGVLELGDGVTLDKSVTDFDLRHGSNPVQTAGTSTLQTKQVTLTVTPTFTVPSGRKLTIAPQGSGVIIGASTGITKAGDGELELTAKANTFNGTVTVSAGTLTVGSVANSGSPGAWGQGSSAVEVTGTLRYNGSGGSTTRSVRMNGTGTPTIDASGTGALFLNSVTQDTNAKTMVLRGTNTDANTVSSNIADNGGAVSLEKLDGGRWVLAGGTLSYTGTTTVSGGILRLETANSNTTSGAVTIGAGGTVELITDTLASSGATAGEVLGTGNVTVNGGTIKTRGGTTQKGQVRYGGNLTFGSGSTLYIGAAA